MKKQQLSVENGSRLSCHLDVNHLVFVFVRLFLEVLSVVLQTTFVCSRLLGAMPRAQPTASGLKGLRSADPVANPVTRGIATSITMLPGTMA